MSEFAAAPGPKKNITPVNTAVLQRKTCSCGRPIVAGGECAECRKKRLALQRRAVNQDSPAVAPSIVHEVLRSPGRPLEPATRAFMESRFNHNFSLVRTQTDSPQVAQTGLTVSSVADRHEREANRVADRVTQTPELGVLGQLPPYPDYDFSQVRIHTGMQAAASARAVNALAYTVGQDIVFGADQYAPVSVQGQLLLAHELTHVIQQTGGSGNPGNLNRSQILQRQPAPLEPPGPSPDYECNYDIFKGEFECCAPVPLVGRICAPDPVTLKKKIEKALKGLGKTPPNLCRGFPGFKPGESSNFKGQCCRGIESKENCCLPDQLAFKDLRCCTDDEVVQEGRCVKRSSLPPIPPSLLCRPEQQTLDGKCCTPPLMPLGLKCILPPVKPPPRPKPSLPTIVEIFFRKDRPATGKTDSSAVQTDTTSQGLSNFEGLVQQLTADPLLDVELVGRASPEGSEEYNLALGARRANTVAAALITAGISASRITASPVAELRSECHPLRPGVVTCGEAGATGPEDRQVLVRIFPRI